MRRIRWFSAEWQTSLRTLASRMRAKPFTDESGTGFLIERAREDRIEARYVEKVAYQETIPTPLGPDMLVDRIAYRQLSFVLYREFPQLAIHDAPRSTQPFMSRLLELTDFSLTVSPLSVDLMAWVTSLRVTISGSVLINMIQVSGLNIAPGVTGSMFLKSDHDVTEALRAATEMRTYTIDRLRIELNGGLPRRVIHLANTASVKLDAAADDQLLLALRASLPRPDDR